VGKINIEKVKCIAYDSGKWFLIEDRPDDYFCRFATSEHPKPRMTCDVYYSKKGSVRLKQKKGQSAHFRIQEADQMEDVFAHPYNYYKNVSHTLLKDKI